MGTTAQQAERQELLADRYRLDRMLAAGGMGTVWTAYDQCLERMVVVKFMARGLVRSSSARVRFEREARALARLQSPHVVQVFDVGEHERLPFLVMELLEGETLEQRLRREERLPAGLAARVIAQVAHALAAVHRHGLVHRDLKPGNVFLSGCADEPVVKLIDFGAVKARDATTREVTQHGMVVGTPHYMSPEYTVTGQVDALLDLWSLAVVAFRMLTGVLPFRGEEWEELVLRLCCETPPKLAACADDLPWELDVFFDRAFARDPDQRYQTVEELAAAFATACRFVADDGAGKRAWRPSGIVLRPSEPEPPTRELPPRPPVSEDSVVVDWADWTTDGS